MLEDLKKLITCGNDESGTVAEELAKKYNCSTEKIYWTVRSIYGKKLKDLRWDFREPDKQDFIKNLFLTDNVDTLRNCYPYICNRQWKGIYDRILGVSTYSKAREKALLESLPSSYTPQTDNNLALWCATRLGDGSYDKVRCSWKIEHCASQKGWLDKKVELFVKSFPQASSKVTYNVKRNTYSWYSCKIGSGKFDKLGRCPKVECVEHLNFFGIWLLFLDDGCLFTTQKGCSFAVENLEIANSLVEKIRSLSGLEFRVANKNEIRITGIENMVRFHKTFLEPFQNITPECMKYKTTYVNIQSTAEIILRPNQFCNLTEVVVRATDTLDTLKEKVRLATVLGTIQSTYTNFPYLRKVWQTNTEEERLLGVSLTGIMDNQLLNGTSLQKGKNIEQILTELKEVAISTNKEWAANLGINQSVAVTCTKPSGTVSQLVDSASGIHPRHSDYYIRTVRGDNKDPLTQFMINSGIPSEPDVMKPDSTTVFSFPQKAPEGAITRSHLTAIQQLELWLAYQRYWCEHKPSITVNVRDSEWLEVGAWVYKHFDEISGISFLPYSDHSYAQAPYQECTKTDYEQLKASMPDKIEWDKLSEFEKEDNTKGSSTFACVGSCEIVDLS